MFNFHFLNRSIDNLENQLVNAVRVSAFLYQSVFQLYKAMYYQLSLVAIQIRVVGFILTDFTAIPMKYLLTRKSNRYSLGI